MIQRYSLNQTLLISFFFLLNYSLEITFITFAILLLFSNFSNSILFLIILSELSWLFFFCFTHGLIKLYAVQSVLFVFIFFLAIATLDLSYVLSLCFFFGKLFGTTSTSFNSYADFSFSKDGSKQKVNLFKKGKSASS